MKYLGIRLIFSLAVMFSVSSCLKEDVMPYPEMAGVKMYMADQSGGDSLVTELVAGKAVKFVIETDADMCSVWPGGIRNIMKKKTSADGVTFADSLDMFRNPVLVNSDMYSDYGLVGARGIKTTLSSNGWYCAYTYPKAGQFDLVVVVTNHGYNNDNFQQKIHEIGKVKVN